MTLFRKPGDQKDGGILSQRIIFAELEFGFLLHEKISIASLQIWTYSSCWVPELKSSGNTYSEKGKGFATSTESGKYGSTTFLSCDFWVRSLPHTLHCWVFSPGKILWYYWQDVRIRLLLLFFKHLLNWWGIFLEWIHVLKTWLINTYISGFYPVWIFS